MCSAAQAPLARIVKSGLMKVNRPDDEVQAAMDEAALRELPKLEARTGYLALLANLAMLSGLLGTVTGLIAAFGAVANADASSKATMLAKGISEAMNCTAFGLLAAHADALGSDDAQAGFFQHLGDGAGQVATGCVGLDDRKSARDGHGPHNSGLLE